MIQNWDDAYDNVGHIAGSASYVGRWAALAAAFRAEMVDLGRAQLDVCYGEHHRERFDLFHPETRRKGLFIFVHGGYWKAFDKSFWSHLAAGMLKKGWAVAMPSYVTAPEGTIAQMTRQVASAICTTAACIDGPLVLAGHSAGGHLVTRMVCADVWLPDPVRDRIQRVVSISGLHDLRPIMRTKMNEVIGMDWEMACLESPALLRPIDGIRLTACHGGNELPEFRRQAALIANIWQGLGVATELHELAGLHHFNVLDGLMGDDREVVEGNDPATLLKLITSEQ